MSCVLSDLEAKDMLIFFFTLIFLIGAIVGFAGGSLDTDCPILTIHQLVTFSKLCRVSPNCGEFVRFLSKCATPPRNEMSASLERK